MSGYSFSNLGEIDSLYRRYLENPESVEPSWRHFFEGWDLALSMAPASQEGGGEVKVSHLIEAFRTLGHLQASFNPIAEAAPKAIPELKIETYGFKESDLGLVFSTCGFLKEKSAPLKAIVEALQKTYCGSIGIEYMGLRMPEMQRWVQQKIEPNFPLAFTRDQKLEILHDLGRAAFFEGVLHTKYTGQTRFSLEGSETLIPMLAFMLEKAGSEEIDHVVIGMAHRGRLNVLAHILSRPYESIFYEFEDYYTPDLTEGVGDVKYHRGFAGSFTTKKGRQLHVTLAANPSHLEAVDPVVEGGARALQEIRGKKAVIPILIHGDAALAGQGIVYETVQMNRLNGYNTGGTVHIVVNNQIGYTTLPKDSRSTLYPTDVALSFGAPVLHVNAEKPEECVAAASLAIELRQKFHCDVFIDLNGYRKYGHNEGDEPSFTQPALYRRIQEKKPIYDLYKEELLTAKTISAEEAAGQESKIKEELQQAFSKISAAKTPQGTPKPKDDPFERIKTAVDQKKLVDLAADFCSIPDKIAVHPKIQKLLADRLAMVKGDPVKPSIDWGMAEHLAFATLLSDAIHVRISGQDSRRGTFAHRHAAIVDQKSEERYFPLSHLKDGKAKFDVFNSHLSEAAVLAFEYGYSLVQIKALVIWEAQYGDFVNSAQVPIDQYLVSGEQKWGHLCRLSLFLPHGYEGKGAEHSSARLERFLQLCSDDNMFVANCTSASQLFHLLRRQALKTHPRPLILMTPKQRLRFAGMNSSLSDFSSGAFEEFLDDPKEIKAPKKALFCSGKVYFDLVEARKTEDAAIIRIEQLYPFNRSKFALLAEKYKGAEWIFVQEEHQNMGAWSYIRPILEEYHPIRYVGRGPSAAAAAGSYALHKQQLAQFIREAF